MKIKAKTYYLSIIAYGKGGVTETVIEGETGIFFREQKVDSLVEAIKNFEQRQDKFDLMRIRKNSERFSRERFRREFKNFVDKKIEEFFN